MNTISMLQYIYKEYGVKNKQGLLTNLDQVVNPINVYGELKNNHIKLKSLDNGDSSLVIKNKIIELNIERKNDENYYNKKSTVKINATFEDGYIVDITVTIQNLLLLLLNAKLGNKGIYKDKSIVLKDDYTVYFYGTQMVIEQVNGKYNKDFNNYRKLIAKNLPTTVAYGLDDGIFVNDTKNLEIGRAYIKGLNSEKVSKYNLDVYIYLGKGKVPKLSIDKGNSIKKVNEDVYLFYNIKIDGMLFYNGNNPDIRYIHDVIKGESSNIRVKDVVGITEKSAQKLYKITLNNSEYLSSIYTKHLIGLSRYEENLNNTTKTIKSLNTLNLTKYDCELYLGRYIKYCRKIYSNMVNLLNSILEGVEYTNEEMLLFLYKNDIIQKGVDKILDYGDGIKGIPIITKKTNSILAKVYKGARIEITGKIQSLGMLENIKLEELARYNKYFKYLTDKDSQKVFEYKEEFYPFKCKYSSHMWENFYIGHWVKYGHFWDKYESMEENSDIRKNYSKYEYINMKKEEYYGRKRQELNNHAENINNGLYSVKLTIGELK